MSAPIRLPNEVWLGLLGVPGGTRGPSSLTLRGALEPQITLTKPHMVGVGLMGFDVVCVVSTLVTIGVHATLLDKDEHKQKHEKQHGYPSPPRPRALRSTTTEFPPT